MKIPSLLSALLLSGLAWAQPPLYRLGRTGLLYELKASCLESGQSWLGGRVKTTAETGWEDGFLTRINGDGSLAWEKQFGSREGGESVDQLAADANGGVFLAGLASCDLSQAWKGEAPVDWNRNAYLAHVDARGSLLSSLDLRVEADDPNQEPMLNSGALCLSSGRVLLGLSFQGKLGPLKSGASRRGAVLACDTNLAQAVYYQVPAQSVQALAQLDGHLYAAGLTQIENGSEMGPPISRPVLWDMTDLSQPRLLWQGEPAENTEIQQLSADGLLITNNDSRQTLRLDLTTLKLERLPEGLLRLSGTTGLGYANGRLEGSQSLGDCDLVIWQRDDQGWRPRARLGSAERDFPGGLAASGQEFLVSATCGGALPGQPKVENRSQNWLWFRFGEQTPLASLGQREPGELRRQLSSRLLNLVFQEEPDFQHLVGFLPGQVITTTPGRGFDGWRRQNLEGQNLQEWFPVQPQQAPLEPQIFPMLEGDRLLCRDPMRRGSAWFRGQQDGLLAGIQAQHAIHDFWLGAEANPKGKVRLLLGQFSGPRRIPINKWAPSCQALGLTAGPDQSLVAIWNEASMIKISRYSRQGKLLQSSGLKAEECTAVLGRPEGLWLAVPGKLLRLNWNGRVESSRSLGPLRVRRIKTVGSELWLLGSRPDPVSGVHQPAWSKAEGGPIQTLPLDRDGFLQDAWAGPDGIWLGGEVVQDYVTDVFWGKLGQP